MTLFHGVTSLVT